MLYEDYVHCYCFVNADAVATDVSPPFNNTTRRGPVSVHSTLDNH
jgi:hypothetical protein